MGLVVREGFVARESPDGPATAQSITRRPFQGRAHSANDGHDGMNEEELSSNVDRNVACTDLEDKVVRIANIGSGLNVELEDCHINLCAETGHLGHADLCKLFETPGTHTLGDLKGDLKGFNGTVAIPPITGMIKNVLKGSWKAQFTLVQGGETLANVKVPANEEWIDVE
ncbi:hypothetical protein QR680_014894 [Steinernema hermaphroditum]|uniref:Uncharacterized protein n=1 Tax=Steinernema hermaphroditum TaxID=289476 RepID=A0AA39M3Z7_9BILA|nr:hypothetical protein QR680_014894 [Steinernema hermaphroditum]